MLLLDVIPTDLLLLVQRGVIRLRLPSAGHLLLALVFKEALVLGDQKEHPSANTVINWK